MIVYFDTSALLKAYVQENSSTEVVALMDKEIIYLEASF